MVALTLLWKPEGDARQALAGMLRDAEERAATGILPPADAIGLIPTTALRIALDNVLSGAASDSNEVKLLAIDAGMEWPGLTSRVRADLESYRRVLE